MTADTLRTSCLAALVFALASPAITGPGDATVSTKPDMDEARYRHASAVCNGELYVIGGRLNQALVITSIHDTSWKTSDLENWTQVTPGPPVARHSHAAVAYNNRIYVTGGRTHLNIEQNDAYYYDCIAGTWTTLPDLAFNVSNHTMEVADGKMWMIDGTTLRSSTDGSNWTNEATVPTAVTEHESAVFGDIIYIVGGNTGGNSGSTHFQAYNTATDTWLAGLPSLNEARYQPMAAIDSGSTMMTVAGGAKGSLGSAGSQVESIEAIDLNSPSNWVTLISPMPTGLTAGTGEYFGGYHAYLGGADWENILAFGGESKVQTVQNPEVPVELSHYSLD